MSKYRFKRLDEYDKSELDDFSLPSGWNKDMKEYLGTDIPCSLNTSCDAKKGFGMDGWYFEPWNYVRKATSKKDTVNNTTVMDNFVIENTSEEHGVRIIKYLKSLGINTMDHEGSVYGDEAYRFYGVIDGKFNNYPWIKVNRQGVSIIKLPEDVDVEKDGDEYFEDLSQHVGRYLRALVNFPHGGNVRAGEIGLIISRSDVNFPSQSEYWCPDALSKGMLHVKYKLMPKDYGGNSTEIIEDSNPTTKEKWAKGTYAVGIKGNFGAYGGAEKPIIQGHIFIIEKNMEDHVVVKESSFWVNKENLKWFSTLEEAIDFKRQLRDSPPPNHSIPSIIEYPSIIKETFIEDVQSVDVILRIKNKSIKF